MLINRPSYSKIKKLKKIKNKKNHLMSNKRRERLNSVLQIVVERKRKRKRSGNAVAKVARFFSLFFCGKLPCYFNIE